MPTESELIQKIEELEKELKSLKKGKNYGLFWKEKQEEFDIKTQDALPVLREVPELTISQNGSLSNIIIEWDNYHALSVLSYTHKWQVDVIYIDPPYNTGNKDFIYNDRYVDKEDDFRHSKWLSFMEKRLKLAKELLNENWTIFISINDHEFAQLKMLCDEIFFEENFYWQFTWICKTKPVNMWEARFKPQKNTESIMVYGRVEISRHAKFFLKEWAEKIYDSLIDNKKCRLEEIVQRRNLWRLRRDTMLYPILGIAPKEWYRWQLSEWRYNELSKAGKIILKNSKLYEVIFEDEENESVAYEPMWTHLEDVWTSENWKSELSEILWIWNWFETVKPLGLIKKILFHSSNPNSLILDFFAGSGTTGHAVLALNKADGGNRRFILCSNRENTTENPEKNICRDITYERVQRVATGYMNTKWEHIEWLGGNIRYLETDFILKHKGTDNLRNRMVERCSEMLCLRENIWEWVERLSDENMRFYERWDRYLAVLFGLFRFSEFSDRLRTLDKPVSIYVFSRGQMTHDDFEGITVPYTVEEIPDPILAVYKNIFWL
jgi:adenine-specific DNA-methyltransferase